MFISSLFFKRLLPHYGFTLCRVELSYFPETDNRIHRFRIASHGSHKMMSRMGMQSTLSAVDCGYDYLSLY